MKKIFLFIGLILALSSFGQTVQSLNPGNTQLVNNFAIASIGGDDTTFKFRFPPGCISYAIGIIQTDTIEAAADLSAWLYGGNTAGPDVQIGDTLILADDAVTQVDYWTGTTFPYAIGLIKIRKLGATDGDITIWVNYAK